MSIEGPEHMEGRAEVLRNEGTEAEIPPETGNNLKKLKKENRRGARLLSFGAATILTLALAGKAKAQDIFLPYAANNGSPEQAQTAEPSEEPIATNTPTPGSTNTATATNTSTPGATATREPTSTPEKGERFRIPAGVLTFVDQVASRLGIPQKSSEPVEVPVDRLEARVDRTGDNALQYSWEQGGQTFSVLAADLPERPSLDDVEINRDPIPAIERNIVEPGSDPLLLHSNHLVYPLGEGGLLEGLGTIDRRYEPLSQTELRSPATIQSMLEVAMGEKMPDEMARELEERVAQMNEEARARGELEVDGRESTDSTDWDTTLTESIGDTDGDGQFKISPLEIGGGVLTEFQIQPIGARNSFVTLSTHADSRTAGPSAWERNGSVAGLMINYVSGAVELGTATFKDTRIVDMKFHVLDLEFSGDEDEKGQLELSTDPETGKPVYIVRRLLGKEVVGDPQVVPAHEAVMTVDTASNRYGIPFRKGEDPGNIALMPGSRKELGIGQDDIKVTLEKDSDGAKELRGNLELAAIGDVRRLVNADLVIAAPSRYDIPQNFADNGIGLDWSGHLRIGPQGAMPDLLGSMAIEAADRKGLKSMLRLDLQRHTRDPNPATHPDKAELTTMAQEVVKFHLANPDLHPGGTRVIDENGNFYCDTRGWRNEEELATMYAETVASIPDFPHELPTAGILGQVENFNTGAPNRLDPILANAFNKLLIIQGQGGHIEVLSVDASATKEDRDRIMELAKEAGLPVRRVLPNNVGRDQLHDTLGEYGQETGVITLLSHFDPPEYTPEGRRSPIESVDKQTRNDSIPMASEEMVDFFEGLRDADLRARGVEDPSLDTPGRKNPSETQTGGFDASKNPDKQRDMTPWDKKRAKEARHM